MPRKITAKNIKKLRLFKALNQTEFAALFDINRSNIGSYEEARAEPKLEILIRIADHFKLTVDQLVRRELTVNEIAGFQLDFDQAVAGKPSRSIDDRLDEITERLAAMDKRLGQLKREK